MVNYIHWKIKTNISKHVNAPFLLKDIKKRESGIMRKNDVWENSYSRYKNMYTAKD